MSSKQILASVVMGLVLSGCATSPVDGGTIANNKSSFSGFAIEPNAPVRVQALVQTGPYDDPESPSATWTTLSTVKASSTASTLSFSRPLYSWTAGVGVPAQYFKNGRTFLRAQQLWAGSWMPMYMYDQLGLGCLVDRYLDAASAGQPLNVDSAGIECSRDTEGKDLLYVELYEPDLHADLTPYRFDTAGNIWLWLAPDQHVPENAALFPAPGGPPAEILCGATYMNVAFAVRNQGLAVATRRRDRVSIPALGLEEIDEQPRVPRGYWGVPITNGIFTFPPVPGRYASFDLSTTVPNQVYTLAFDINHDHAAPESDYNNNHLEVTFMRKCP